MKMFGIQHNIGHIAFNSNHRKRLSCDEMNQTLIIDSKSCLKYKFDIFNFDARERVDQIA